MTMTKTFAFKPNDVVTFHPTQSDLMMHDGKPCIIDRVLGDDECDYCETGPMYRIHTIDGFTMLVVDAFEDELTKED